MMGSPASETEHGIDEEPQRKVTIARPFAVGKFEVTFADWDACVADGGCKNEAAIKVGAEASIR
jgi:formylglycine-generating enzyme required for sulfatase activity